jgi:hypothetical protein
MINSIVEYATREQAQQAVAQLSNQNLMGRLVYVREVGQSPLLGPVSVPGVDVLTRRFLPSLGPRG